jgi:hypothetical protein
MVPAKITNLNPVQVTYKSRINKVGKVRYKPIEIIADVENAEEFAMNTGEVALGVILDGEDYGRELKLNQSCFIELTRKGKCKIVKL